MNLNRVSGMAIAAALGFAAVAHAQMPPPPPPGAGMGPMAGHEMTRDGMMGHHGMREAMRVKAVHDALNIRPDQEAVFSALAQSMKPDGMGDGPGSGDMMRDHQAMGGMTTPQRLDMMARKMDEHMKMMRDHFQTHAAAARALYAVLTPDQRRTFDALPALMGHPGMGMGMGMSSHGGMGHPGDDD